MKKWKQVKTVLGNNRSKMHAMASRFQPLIEHSTDLLNELVFYKIILC